MPPEWAAGVRRQVLLPGMAAATRPKLRVGMLQRPRLHAKLGLSLMETRALPNLCSSQPQRELRGPYRTLRLLTPVRTLVWEMWC